MTFTVSPGWWLLPTAVTVIMLWVYGSWRSKQEPSYGYGAIGAGLGEALVLLACFVVVAVAWIAYLSVRLYVAG